MLQFLRSYRKIRFKKRKESIQLSLEITGSI